MNTKATKILAVATTIALGFTLTACTPDDQPTPAPSASPTVTDGSSSTPGGSGGTGTKQEVPTFAAGDVITADQVDALPETQGAVTLSSGETVVVDKDERLPDVVLNDVAAPFLAAGLENPTAANAAAVDTVFPKIQEVKAASDRTVVIVKESGSYDVNNNLEYTFWATLFVGEPKNIVITDQKSNPTANQHPTSEAAVAYAENVISRTKYDERYDIVVAQ
ncbi:hypothetical protein [Cellulosimicrobium sp. 72-3]|uniref:hypothetical protein n=1 Tax=Cellulosimicrobium sp. 72-3 TaxID=2731680 RepID=UPI00148EE98F|nr:hypothetical protein [Cellulosimicrobium sp. 72-3]